MGLGNGAIIEQAEDFASEVLAQLDRIAEGVHREEIERESVTRRGRVQNTTGAPADSHLEIPLPAGVVWVLKRWACQASATPTGFVLYADAIDELNVLDVAAVGPGDTGSRIAELPIPQGTTSLIVQTLGLPADAWVGANLGITQYLEGDE